MTMRLRDKVVAIVKDQRSSARRTAYEYCTRDRHTYTARPQHKIE